MKETPPPAALSPERLALLSLKLKNRRRHAPEAQLLPRGGGGAYPLSFQQEQLWFVHELEPLSPVHHLHHNLTFHGPLDAAALGRSFDELVRRHEILRTSFQAGDGRPFQSVAAAPPGVMSADDLRHLSEAEQLTRVEQLTREHFHQPFDWTRGPLLRVALLRLGEEKHLLLLTLHHITTDWVSFNVLFREVSTLYESFSRGRPSPLVDLPIQYGDFALWQRQTLQGEVLDNLVSHWRAQLSGAPTFLQLPTDRPRPAVQTFRGRRRYFLLPLSLYDSFAELSRRENVTPFTTLLAVFQVFLHRYTAQADLLVGTPSANRDRMEFEQLIGFFLNTLVLRGDFSGNPTFREFLRRLSETVVNAQTHQALPFQKLVQELQPERGPNHTPLVQTNFIFLNYLDSGRAAGDTGEHVFTLPGLRVSGAQAPIISSEFDLTLALEVMPKGLVGFFEYNEDLFDESTVESMTQCLRTLMEATLNNPDERVAALPLLTPETRDELLTSSRGVEIAHPAPRFLHELFEAQAAKTPDAVALEFEDEVLSYRELDCRSNQTAHYLRGLGVGAESYVGVLLERSAEMVMALLAVLKAGGAYVPLDPADPRERLQFMLEDSGVGLLLTRRDLPNRPEQSDAGATRVVCLDAEREEISRQSVGAVRPHLSSENLAYVIYTSGSTGRPKGAMNTHAGIRNRLRWMQDAYGLTPSDRALQKTPLTFDVSVWELFWPLTTGARLVVARPNGHRDNSYLTEVIAGSQVTTLHFVPTMLQTFLEEPHLADSCRSLRRVVCSGEALSAELAARFHERLPGVELHNLYGPTEAGVDVSAWRCEPSDTRRHVPIGRAIANTQLYMLDGSLEPVPWGVRGEIYIGGVQLARGYHKRPGLTAERFVPDPFSPRAGARLYRTGDVARLMRDGNIEYVRRVDHQIKLRGFRIELGEVEQALESHELVRQAVALVRDDSAGDKRLTAYVVPTLAGGHEAAQDDAALRDELRRHLRRRLPEYMLPSAFMVLGQLPLTAGGKVDRKALAALDPGRTRPGPTYVAPSTEVEKLLADTWAEILRLPQVGVHDNFFELGGDSILGIQMIARLNQAGLRLTSTQLFEFPTVAELAALAEARGQEGLKRDARQDAVTGIVPLTPIQCWFFDEEPTDPHHFNQALMVATPPGLDADALAAALGWLVEHHDALRLRFTRDEGGWRQFNAAPEESLPLERADLSARSEQEQSAFVAERATRLQQSFDLSRGPLVRAAYFHLGAGREGRLLLIIHHLCVDGVSWRVLLEDLRDFYEQMLRADEVTLPAKTTSFKRWAERLAEYAQGNELKEEASYWLAAVPEKVVPLPVDYPEGANTVETERYVTTRLDPEETTALLREVPKAARADVQEVLLAGLAQAVYVWAGLTRLLVDVEGHGREALFEDVDLSRTVGWFTNIYPVLLDVTGPQRGDVPPKAGELLKATKERLRAVPRRGVGYGLLRYLRPNDDAAERLRARPGAQVQFNYLGQLDDASVEGAAFRPAPVSGGPARSPHAVRRYLLEVNCGVEGGELHIVWTYGAGLYERATVERLAREHLSAVRALVAQCRRGGWEGLTAADFPRVKLKPEQVNALLTKLKKGP